MFNEMQKSSQNSLGNITVQDRHQITQNVLGEHKVITTEQQFLGVILSFFMHLRWPWLSCFFCVNAVEAI